MKNGYSSIIDSLLISCCFVFAACNVSKKYFNPTHPIIKVSTEFSVCSNVVFIGDAGDITDTTTAFFTMAKKQIAQCSNKKSLVVFLGDNIYPTGLRNDNQKHQLHDELMLDNQLALVHGFGGDVLFIPGNHDWNKGHKKGENFVFREAAYLTKQDSEILLGPVPGNFITVIVKNDIVIVALDTQYWLQKENKEISLNKLISTIDSVLTKYHYKQLVVVGHHPMISNGYHGGHYSWRQHIFPLVDQNKFLYIPLPVIGSLYPLYRKIIGSNTDLANNRYRELADALQVEFENFPRLLYVSGHDHNLQFTARDKVNYLICGSGSNTAYFKKNKHIYYGNSAQGIGVLSVTNQKSTIQTIVVDNKLSAGKQDFIFNIPAKK